MTPGPDWNIADVLDFEFLLADDARENDEVLRSRDRALFVDKIEPEIGASARDRKTVLRSWVVWRRAKSAQILPGEAYATGWQTLVTASVAVGLLTGVSLSAGLLHYSANEPINALVFLGWTLGPQLLLLLFSLLLGIERNTTGFLSEWRPLRSLLAGLTALFSAGLRRMPGEQRARVSSVMGRFGPKRDAYRPLATWSFLIVTQVFAVCFNLGIIATVLVELPARELRFGWQTTLDVRSEDVAPVVRAIATPWQWAPAPYPSADQIIATRYAPGQSHRELSPGATRAWWPFLVYAVVTYGLLLRGTILIISATQLRRSLRELKLDHADANALWRRLTGPLLTSRGGEATLPVARTSEETVRPPAERVGNCFCIRAQELELPEESVRTTVQEHFRWHVAEVRTAQIDNRRASGELLDRLRSVAGELAAVTIIAPATRDPIVAVALFLKEVVAAVAGKGEVLVLLTGELKDGRIEPAPEARVEIWRRFRDIQALPIGIERWP